MSNSNPKRILILFGGRSSEHEISLRSAQAVFERLDRAQYLPIGVGISRDGRWYVDQVPPAIASDPEKEVRLPLRWKEADWVLEPVRGSDSPISFDLVFPVMHGPLYEDGALQGLFELCNLPFVGSGVAASALAMHKNFTKQLLSHHGIPVAPAVVVKKAFWEGASETVQKEVSKQMKAPWFVKPSNMGSSVGVHRVNDLKSLDVAMKDAFQYDDVVLIEKGIQGREIELSVLENQDSQGGPLVSLPGEIISHHEFYSYEAKYIDEKGAELVVPTDLESDLKQKAQKIAAHAFDALGCQGMARVDLFIEKETNEIFVNELNTLPGFTSISMYPKLWEASGISFSELLDRLIQLGLQRHQADQHLKRDWVD